MKKWLILAGSLLLTDGAAAAEINVDLAPTHIFDVCEKAAAGQAMPGQDLFDVGFCRGFIFGAMMSVTLPSNVCVGPIKYYDALLIFNAFVKKNPVWRTKEPSEAFTASIADAFPCSKK